jgi:hypothetical protein
MATRATSKVTTDHDEIRRWAEARGAKPAAVRGTGGRGDPGIIRLDFPGYTGADKLEPISWDDWFRKFDQGGLALLHQERTAAGQLSNFNKLVSRETAEAVEQKRKPVRKQVRAPAGAAARAGAPRRATAKRPAAATAKRPAAATARTVSRPSAGRTTTTTRTRRTGAAPSARAGTKTGAKRPAGAGKGRAVKKPRS